MGTVFFGPLMDEDPTTTEAIVAQAFPVAGSLSNLNVRLTGQPGSGG